MKKVTLLGDSIRQIGYGTKVPEMLGPDYEVFQPEDNCRFVKYTLRMLFDFKAQIEGSDVIHWNNGLWDISTALFDDGEPFTSEEEYVENMLRIARLLKEITPKVIFATTTPVNPKNPHNKNSDIERFNALIVPRLKEMDIQINDLYSLVAEDIEGNICDDLIHLSDKGIEVCSKKVAKVIRDNFIGQ